LFGLRISDSCPAALSHQSRAQAEAPRRVQSWTLSFLLAGTLAVPLGLRAQVCPIGGGVNCYVQYQTAWNEGAKCAVEEFTNATLPRVHWYRTELTSVNSSENEYCTNPACT